MERQVWPILLIDDEPSDINDLDSLLREIENRRYNAFQREFGLDLEIIDKIFPVGNPVPRQANSPYDAIESMVDFMEKGYRFSAIVCDNHLKSLGEDDEGVDGDDLLRIMTGNLASCFSFQDEPNFEISDYRSFESISHAFNISASKAYGSQDIVIDFMNTVFDEGREGIINYGRFVKYWFDNRSYESPHLLMLCGMPSEAKLHGIEDKIEVTKKSVSLIRGDVSLMGYLSCEKEIISSLEARAVFWDPCFAMGKHSYASSFTQKPIERFDAMLERNYGSPAIYGEG